MRASIYMGAPLQGLVEDFESRSGRINEVAARYQAILDADCPGFTQAEWSAICEALNGFFMEGVESHPRLAWAEISEADRIHNLGQKWDVDAEALALRVRALPMGALIAVCEVVQRFWQYPNLDPDTALAKAGAKVA